MAHAVLLSHPDDDPVRRRNRLHALRELATGKAETAGSPEQAQLELLAQEYGLAGAMDMGSDRWPTPTAARSAGAPGPGEPGQGRRAAKRRARPRPGNRPFGERSHDARPLAERGSGAALTAEPAEREPVSPAASPEPAVSPAASSEPAARSEPAASSEPAVSPPATVVPAGEHGPA